MNKLKYIFLSLIIGFAAQAMEEPVNMQKLSLHEQLEEAASRGDLEEVKKVLDHRIFLEFLNHLRREHPQFYAVKDVLKLCFKNLMPFTTKRDRGGSVLASALADAARFHSQACCEFIVDKLLRIPNDQQRKRMDTLMLCLRCRARMPRDILQHCMKPHMIQLIAEENRENLESIAFQEVLKIENEEMMQKLLAKYCPEK